MPPKKKKSGSILDILGEDALVFNNFGAWPSWKTGIPFIDIVTGIGGLPRGRICECFGPESSGKTTIFLKAAAEAQSLGKKTVFLDYEDSLDPNWVTSLGVDLRATDDEGLPLFQAAVPETLERGFEIMEGLLEQNDIALIIVDSLAAMVPEKQLDPDFNMDRAGMYKAKQLRALMSNLVTKMKKSDSEATIGFINHEYEEIGFSPSPGKKYTTGGGKALKYYASMRIEFRNIGNITEEVEDKIDLTTEKRKVATKIRATIVKNKVASPFKRTTFVCREGFGIDVVGSIYELALTRGLIKQSGRYFYIPEKYSTTGEEMRIDSKAEFIEYIRTETDMYKKLEDDIVNIIEQASTEGVSKDYDENELEAGLEFFGGNQ